MSQPTSSADPSPVGARGALRAVLRNPYVWAFVIGAITLTAMRPLLRREPPPPPVLATLPEFALTSETGRPFGSADLAGRVWIVDLIFTRCTSICPLLTRALGRLQQEFDERGIEGVGLLSISVDPEYDTPERLRQYARRHGADPDRWRFVTGDRAAIRKLVEEGLMLPLGDSVIESGDLIEIAHSGKLVLVDGAGGIRGYYEIDPDGLEEVFHRSRHVLRESRRR